MINIVTVSNIKQFYIDNTFEIDSYTGLVNSIDIKFPTRIMLPLIVSLINSFHRRSDRISITGKDNKPAMEYLKSGCD